MAAWCCWTESPSPKRGPLHGLALDIGTTTVALRLYDLETGRLLATQSFENPQRFGGSDIMARIHYDGAHKGDFCSARCSAISRAPSQALPGRSATIYELVVAGNPTMRDLLFGLDVQPIGVLPYRSTTEAALDDGRSHHHQPRRHGEELRLPVHPEARVYGLPLVGSHVGRRRRRLPAGDGHRRRRRLCALLDIGTNTEAFLGNRGGSLAASCPAGPAFEGGGVTFGMPALDGAIERVRIRDDGSLEIHAIGDARPAGICGSGLVDLLSELRRTGRMNEQGRFADDGEPAVLARPASS